MSKKVFHSHDFLYVDNAHTAAYSDFTDPAVFTPAERKAFLAHYADYLKGFYDLPDESLYAARLDEARALAREFDKREVAPKIASEEILGGFRASLLPKPRIARDLTLYTGKATLEGGAILLGNAKLPPNPAAMYHIPENGRMTSFSFDFFMDEAYKAPVPSSICSVLPKRQIDLRAGVLDLLRISFFSNGECYVSPMKDPYHHDFVLVGKFDFNSWQSVKIAMDGENFTVALNDCVSEPMPLADSVDPDGIFFSGGMYHVGDWFIRPIAITFAGGVTSTAFFAPAEPCVAIPESVGTQDLPFAVGMQPNRDKILVLEREITLVTGTAPRLLFDALDPGGRVYVDGDLLIAADGFDSFSLDLSAYADGAQHTLRVEVDPRAPEVLYTWHRHRDPYNGWFCERICLVTDGAIAFRNLCAVTNKIENGKADLTLTGNISAPATVRVYLTKTNPGLGEEREIASFSANGSFSQDIAVAAEAWSPENPALYALRFVAEAQGKAVGDALIETGFRTVEQRNGKIYLNGEPIVLKGNLIMQYLPPYEETPLTHICPRSEQIVWQYQMNKNAGGNTIRLHILGYGTNDERFARYADKMGILLIWITRYIDGVAQVAWGGKWQGADAYAAQMRARINHPSIIMWEGANEPRPTLRDIDNMYEQFVTLAKSVDTSRLLSPTSHHYYHGVGACECYTNDGKHDYQGNAVTASSAWHDPLVVRSSHPYIDFLGYGLPWERLRTQPDEDRLAMFSDPERAYMASEFAVIGRQDPRTPEANAFINYDSYELCNEDVLGFQFTNDEWLLSQAWQAVAVHHTVKQLRRLDADGMLWCCLMSGANNGSYLKPLIDNYGYAKLGFYAMREGFGDAMAALADVDTKKGANFSVAANLYGKAGKTYSVISVIKNECGEVITAHDYGRIFCKTGIEALPEWDSGIQSNGYYAVEFSVTEE